MPGDGRQPPTFISCPHFPVPCSHSPPVRTPSHPKAIGEGGHARVASAHPHAHPAGPRTITRLSGRPRPRRRCTPRIHHRTRPIVELHHHPLDPPRRRHRRRGRPR